MNLRLSLPSYRQVLILYLVLGVLASTQPSLDHIGKALGVGFAGGMAGGLIAGAIGLVSVPLINIFLQLPVHQAVATNLFQTIFTAASGAMHHQSQGNVNLRLAMPLLMGALVGAPLGAWSSIGLPPYWLRMIFSVILVLMAINLIRRLIKGTPQKPKWLQAFEQAGDVQGRNWFTKPIQGTFRGHDYHVPRALAIGLGLGIGFVSGLLGIGGGFLVTPLVATFLHVPTHLAVGTGLVVISSNAVFGTFPHLLAGNVLWTTGILLSIGGSFGAKLGSRLSKYLPEKGLFSLFTLVLLVVAWKMSPL